MSDEADAVKERSDATAVVGSGEADAVYSSGPLPGATDPETGEKREAVPTNTEALEAAGTGRKTASNRFRWPGKSPAKVKQSLDEYRFRRWGEMSVQEQEDARHRWLRIRADQSEKAGVAMNQPYGARSEFSRNVMRLVADTGDDIRAGLADPETVNDYLAALRDGVKAKSEFAIREYGKIMKLVDAERTVVVEVLHQLGMTSMEELERMVSVHKNASATTPEQKFAVCMDFVDLFLNAHPEKRAMAVKRLGGEVVVTSDSYAVVDGGDQAT